MRKVAVLALIFVLVSGCAPQAAQQVQVVEETTLTISGSGSVSTLLTAVEADFEGDVPGYKLNILSGSGTGGGVKGVLDGSLDAAAMAREPKEEESEKGVQYVGFGSSGVAIITHPSVEVRNLTQAQVKAIFAGEITNWSAVGGQDMEIVFYVRDEDESATVLLRQLIFGDTPFPETVAGVLTSLGDMLTTIEATPGSIGFASWTGVVAGDKKVQAVTLDGIQPNDPEYSAQLPLGIGYVTNHKETVQPLITWLTSQKGREALQQLGVINP